VFPLLPLLELPLLVFPLLPLFELSLLPSLSLLELPLLVFPLLPLLELSLLPLLVFPLLPLLELSLLPLLVFPLLPLLELSLLLLLVFPLLPLLLELPVVPLFLTTDAVSVLPLDTLEAEDEALFEFVFVFTSDVVSFEVFTLLIFTEIEYGGLGGMTYGLYKFPQLSNW